MPRNPLESQPAHSAPSVLLRPGMMTRTNLLALALASLSLAACATDSTPESGRSLALTQNTSTDVAGSFTAEGTAVTFHFSRRGADLAMQLADADGIVILDSKVEHGLEVTTVFSQSTFTRPAGQPAAFDRDALAELAAAPEIQLLPALAKELDRAGIDPALLAGPTVTTTTGGTESPVSGTALCPPVRGEGRWHWGWAPALIATTK